MFRLVLLVYAYSRFPPSPLNPLDIFFFFVQRCGSGESRPDIRISGVGGPLRTRELALETVEFGKECVRP